MGPVLDTGRLGHWYAYFTFSPDYNMFCNNVLHVFSVDLNETYTLDFRMTQSHYLEQITDFQADPRWHDVSFKHCTNSPAHCHIQCHAFSTKRHVEVLLTS